MMHVRPSVVGAAPARMLCTIGGMFRRLGVDSIPEDANYFQMLSMPETFEVDIRKLDSEYKALQRILHPDRFSLKNDADQELATECSGRVNDAVATLRVPLPRACYMLRVLHGIDTEAEGTMQNDQALLMEVLEIREAVEDAESYDEDIRPLLEANAVSVASCMENVSRLLSEPDPDGAKAMVTRWQYYEKIREEIELWKDRNAVE